MSDSPSTNDMPQPAGIPVIEGAVAAADVAVSVVSGTPAGGDQPAVSGAPAVAPQPMEIERGPQQVAQVKTPKREKSFISKFSGPMKGYVFKQAGTQGAGYYLCETTTRPSSRKEGFTRVPSVDGEYTQAPPINLSDFEQAIARLDLHAPEGTRPGWIKRAFDLFDVDGNGKIESEELYFALGTTVMGAKAAGTYISAKDCLHKVLFSPQEMPVVPEPNAYSGKFKEEEGCSEGRCGECSAFFCMCLIPCWVYCPFARLSVGEYSTATVGWKWQRPEKIHGMEAAIRYINECKNETVVEYHWQVYWIREYTASSGDTTYTASERMILADTTGRLTVEDRSPVFVPNTQHKSVVLASELGIEFGDSFAERYKREKAIFFHLNSNNMGAAKYLEEYKLPGMKDSQEIYWLEVTERFPTHTEAPTRQFLSWLEVTERFSNPRRSTHTPIPLLRFSPFTSPSSASPFSPATRCPSPISITAYCTIRSAIRAGTSAALAAKAAPGPS